MDLKTFFLKRKSEWKNRSKKLIAPFNFGKRWNGKVKIDK